MPRMNPSYGDPTRSVERRTCRTEEGGRCKESHACERNSHMPLQHVPVKRVVLPVEASCSHTAGSLCHRATEWKEISLRAPR